MWSHTEENAKRKPPAKPPFGPPQLGRWGSEMAAWQEQLEESGLGLDPLELCPWLRSRIPSTSSSVRPTPTRPLDHMSRPKTRASGRRGISQRWEIP
ncbi:hypothetical protein TorRG33x02_264280 [Trema orientale]|uniref:Uncharacterized protein n=1 Tax=Trema orientale TaxID=63057 RepID=A0A2P5D2W6_TREOI|nr:hypothetical protein TorRG33x02_264280 [Trema orientale]